MFGHIGDPIATEIGNHLVDSIAIAIQCCNGKALQMSVVREVSAALGAEAA